MLYVIYGIDAPGAGEIRSRTRPAHLARIKALKQAGRLELVGPMPNIDAPSLEAGVICMPVMPAHAVAGGTSNSR